MEETNITKDTNQPIETSSINLITPKPNIYKYLFFVTLILLLGGVVYFYTNTNNNNPQPVDNIISQITPSVIPNEEIINEVTPTTIVKTKVSYKAISIEDDKNSISKLVLIDQDNNETVIDEEKYWYMAENTMKVGYWDFVFSPDNNYLYYVRGAISYLYNFKNKKSISLSFSADTKEFSLDSKYFYACSEGGMVSGGAIIKELTSLNNIFLSQDKNESYKCEYNKDAGELLLSKTTSSGLVGGEKILSQYKFSEKTGVLTKIK